MEKKPEMLKQKQQQKTPRKFLLTWKLLQNPWDTVGDSELGNHSIIFR